MSRFLRVARRRANTVAAALVVLGAFSVYGPGKAPSASATSAPTCRSSSLRTTALRNAGLGHGSYIVELRNVTATSCRLSGYPRVVTSPLGMLTPLVGAPLAGPTTPAPVSPVSVSFLPSGEGWMLAAYHCGTDACVRVEHTSNAGRTWTTAAVPNPLQRVMRTTTPDLDPFAQLNIYFANAENGWIYGFVPSGNANGTTNAVLWSTHDAGRKWYRISLASLGLRFAVLSVGASHGQVYTIGWNTDQTFGLWRSPITTDSWRRIHTPTLTSAAGGTAMEGALVFKGTSGWLMVGNDRGVTGAARLTSLGQWVKWAGPCATVGGNFAVPVAYSPTSLVDVCTIGGFGGDVTPGTPKQLKMSTNWIFTSHDGGLTFTPTHQIGVGIPTMWINQVPGLPASPSPGAIFVAKLINKGQTSPEHLFATSDGGRTWTSVYTASPQTAAIQLVTFASPRLGAAIVQITSSTSFLIVSTDGGRTWRQSVSTPINAASPRARTARITRSFPASIE